MYNLRRFVIKIHQLGKCTAAVILLLLPVLIFLSYLDLNLDPILTRDLKSKNAKISTYYVLNTTNCKIPDLDPFNSDVLPFLKVEKYQTCSDKPLLSYIEHKNDVVTLKINESVIPLYSALSISCCYSEIVRDRNRDRTVIHSTCEWFEKEIYISYPYIRVTCKNIFGIIYRNVHAVIIPQIFPKKISKKPKNGTNPLKIFMLGIDSISKLNLQRSMPKVFSYLERDFVGFKGYNKIEDNTFPNLMAILTGRSMNTLNPICMRNMTFDDCDIIWKTFRENGFLTAYGEDEPFLNTFNYLKKGFIIPPTDYYLRPYFLSAYLLPMTYRYLMGVCTGPENTAERILNFAKDFVKVFRNDPTFSLFWINSFSHDNVNLPTSMDDKFLNFLTDVDLKDNLNNSIVIIFSDHGFRFGDIRFTYSGWLEERLPFFYIKFPKTFQESHSQYYKNFIFNAHNRLTNPYDIHMTLQHLLNLSNNSYDIKPSLGCPSCKSLFEKIQENRSCGDGGIPHHWCTCHGYNVINNKNEQALKVGQYVVDQLNQLILSFSRDGHKCAQYELDSIHSVGRSEKKSGNDAKTETYLIIIKTRPYATFEATVKVNGSNFELLGDFSRLNKYGPYTSCIRNDVLMKYCVCNTWYINIISRFCYLFSCP